jgi:hypothetical protein
MVAVPSVLEGSEQARLAGLDLSPFLLEVGTDERSRVFV